MILGEAHLFVEKYNPDTKLSNRAVLIFNDNAMMHVKKILQRRQKQLILDKFLIKNTPRSQIIYNCIDVVGIHQSVLIDF